MRAVASIRPRLCCYDRWLSRRRIAYADRVLTSRTYSASSPPSFGAGRDDEVLFIEARAGKTGPTVSQ